MAEAERLRRVPEREVSGIICHPEDVTILKDADGRVLAYVFHPYPTAPGLPPIPTEARWA